MGMMVNLCGLSTQGGGAKARGLGAGGQPGSSSETPISRRTEAGAADVAPWLRALTAPSEVALRSSAQSSCSRLHLQGSDLQHSTDDTAHWAP